MVPTGGAQRHIRIQIVAAQGSASPFLKAGPVRAVRPNGFEDNADDSTQKCDGDVRVHEKDGITGKHGKPRKAMLTPKIVDDKSRGSPLDKVGDVRVTRGKTIDGEGKLWFPSSQKFGQHLLFGMQRQGYSLSRNRWIIACACANI